MKKASLYILTAAVLLTACGTTHNVLTDTEKAAGWELLFDGQTLNGWRDYNGTGLTAPWVAEDGTLAALGKGDDANGYIVTEKQYENFEFVFDWKIAPGGNSGVLYHVIENPKFKTPYVTGPEFQVIDNDGFSEKLEDWQKTGANYAMNATTSRPTKPVGE